MLGARQDLFLLAFWRGGAQPLPPRWPPLSGADARAWGMRPGKGSDTCFHVFSPRKVLAHEAETAGAVMAFFLALGLALGAAVSFLFQILI